MKRSFAKKYGFALFLASVTLVGVLTPSLLSTRADVERRSACHDRLAPAEHDLLSDPARAEAAGAEAVLAAGVALGEEPGLAVDLPVADAPVHVAVAATSEDLRHVCADVTIAFVPSADLDELPLLVPTFPGAVSFPTIRLDGERLPDAPVDPRSNLHRIRLDDRLPAGRPAVVRVVTDVELPRDWEERSAMDGHLPSVDLASPMPPRDRHHRAGPAVWSVTMRSAATFVSGGVDAACGDGCLRSLATDLPLPLFSAVTGEPRTVGDDGATRVRAAGGVPADVAREVAAASKRFGELLGPLPWTEVDVVATVDEPLGLPTPGIVGVGGDLATGAAPCGEDDAGDCTAAWTGAHAAAHQWLAGVVVVPFSEHRVVVESMANYLAYTHVARTLGEDAARQVRDGVTSWYADAWPSIAGQLPARAPRDLLAPRQELALVHGRGTLAWLAAEDAVGRGALAEFIAELLSEHRGDTLSLRDVRRLAEAMDPAILEALDRHWFSGERLDIAGA